MLHPGELDAVFPAWVGPGPAAARDGKENLPVHKREIGLARRGVPGLLGPEASLDVIRYVTHCCFLQEGHLLRLREWCQSTVMPGWVAACTPSAWSALSLPPTTASQCHARCWQLRPTAQCVGGGGNCPLQVSWEAAAWEGNRGKRPRALGKHGRGAASQAGAGLRRQNERSGQDSLLLSNVPSSEGPSEGQTRKVCGPRTHCFMI